MAERKGFWWTEGGNVDGSVWRRHLYRRDFHGLLLCQVRRTVVRDSPEVHPDAPLRQCRHEQSRTPARPIPLSRSVGPSHRPLARRCPTVAVSGSRHLRYRFQGLGRPICPAEQPAVHSREPLLREQRSPRHVRLWRASGPRFLALRHRPSLAPRDRHYHQSLCALAPVVSHKPSQRHTLKERTAKN